MNTHPPGAGSVLALLTAVRQRAAVPGVLLERDGDYPTTPPWPPS